MQFSVTKDALAYISIAGFDPLFGARPLKRSIQQGIENPLAQKILSGEFKEGSCVVVDVINDSLVFKSN
jgi:ATP-dependent Clp protease ATP-binding subunit ClpB